MSEREQLVSENMGLVHSCAARFKSRGIEYDDLCQAGCVGLIKAADRFDPDMGYQFSTYAVPVILGEIRRLFRDGGAIKVSRGLKELGMKITRLTEEYVHEHGREPTVSELSEIAGVAAEQITEALSASMPPLSLTIPDEEGDIQNDIPMPSPENKLTEILSLRTELRRLTADDRRLIYLRFFCNYTQNRTAQELHMTQVQISRKEKKLLLYLRAKLQ